MVVIVLDPQMVMLVVVLVILVVVVMLVMVMVLIGSMRGTATNILIV